MKHALRTALLLTATALVACERPQPFAPEVGEPARSPSLAALAGGAGELLGVVYQGTYPNGVFAVVSVDPVQGTTTTRGQFPAFDARMTGGTALDPTGNRFFQVAGGPVNGGLAYHVYTVDLGSGAVTRSTRALAPVPQELRYDAGSGTLYGIAYVGSYPDGDHRLVSVDPLSGQVTEIGAFPAMGRPIATAAVLDEAAGRFFLVGGTETGGQHQYHLYAVDTGTGAASVIGALPFAPNDLEFDSSTGTLVGVAYRGTYPDGSHAVVRVDPVSAQMTELGVVEGMRARETFASALDPASGRFFLTGAAVLGSDQKSLFTVDLSTGATSRSAQTMTPPPGELHFRSVALTPEQQVARIADQVGTLASAGALADGQSTALTSKLEAALKSLGRGQEGAAIQQLRAFANQCQALIRGGVLAAGQGQPLIDAAERLVAELRS